IVPSLVRGSVEVVRGFARPGRPGPSRCTLPRRYSTGGGRRGACVRSGPHRHDGRDRGRRVSRKLQALLFLGGSAVFAYLVTRIGVGRLLADAAQTGWTVLPNPCLSRVASAC